MKITIQIDHPGREFSIDCSGVELALLHGAIKEIMMNDFDWFSSEDKQNEIQKLDNLFDPKSLKESIVNLS